MEAIISLVRELIIRFSLKSPKLFVQIQWWVGTFITILAGVLLLNTTVGWGLDLIMVINIPLTTIIGGVIAFLSGVFGIAKITVEDKVKLSDRVNK